MMIPNSIWTSYNLFIHQSSLQLSNHELILEQVRISTWQGELYIVKPALKDTLYIYIYKSLSITDSLIFPLKNSAYNYNLYTKGNCSYMPNFQVPLTVLLSETFVSNM